MKYLLKLTFMILILASCKNDLKKDKKDPDFPYSLSQILEHKMIGESVEFSSIYPDSSGEISKMFCDTFDANQELYLEKFYANIDPTTYHFFHASPIEEFPWFCYSGTFYLNVNNLDSLFQYNQEFKYSTDSLSKLMVQTAMEENLTISELLKFRQYETSTFWTPKLFFFIEFDECDDETLFKINKAKVIIDNSLKELKSNYLESEIELTPRIIIKKRVPTKPIRNAG